MPTEEEIRESLEAVLVPGVMRSLVKLNLIRQIAVSDQKVNISLAAAALNQGAQDWLKDKVRDVIGNLDGVKETEVNFTDAKPKDVNKVKHVIAVMSGKGGVGKSLVASLAGLSLARPDMKWVYWMPTLPAPASRRYLALPPGRWEAIPELCPYCPGQALKSCLSTCSCPVRTMRLSGVVP